MFEPAALSLQIEGPNRRCLSASSYGSIQRLTFVPALNQQLFGGSRSTVNARSGAAELSRCIHFSFSSVSLQVDQSEGMLSEDVQEKGFALMCISKPLSDCKILCIEEEELLGQMMHSGEL